MLEECNVICACVNRWDCLEASARSWSRAFLPERTFVATAPWSRPPVVAPSFNYVEVEHNRFSLGLWLDKAYEASLLDEATFTWKLDADMAIENPVLLEEATLGAKDDEFLIACEIPGIWDEKPWDDRFMGLTGTVGLPTHVIGEVGGWECRIHNWGLDDVVMYRELMAMGMRPKVVQAFSHRWHGPAIRTQNYEIKDLGKSIEHNRKVLAGLDPAGRNDFWKEVKYRIIGRAPE